jgi:hypothetical protein
VSDCVFCDVLRGLDGSEVHRSPDAAAIRRHLE